MTNWNFDEEPYPGPHRQAIGLADINGEKHEVYDVRIGPTTYTFPVAGQITMPMQPHLSRVPLLKPGDVYFESGRPLGIIESVNYSDQTFTIRPQGTYVR